MIYKSLKSLIAILPSALCRGCTALFLEYCSGSGRRARAFYAPLPPGTDAPGAGRRAARLSRALAGVASAAGRAERWINTGGGAEALGERSQAFRSDRPAGGPSSRRAALHKSLQGGHRRWLSAPGDGSRQADAAVFWLATEDHDFAEINHVIFPARRELRRLEYSAAPVAPQQVGGLVLDDSITPLVDQAYELLGASDAMEAVGRGPTSRDAPSPRPFAEFYSRPSPRRGCWCWTQAAAPFTASALLSCARLWERADELHAALVERNRSLEAAAITRRWPSESIRACCSSSIKAAARAWR